MQFTVPIRIIMKQSYNFLCPHLLFGILIFIFSCTNAYAQNSDIHNIIKGQVIEDASKKTIPGAIVTLYDANSHLMINYTYTNHKGEFHILNNAALTEVYLVASSSKNATRSRDFKAKPGATKFQILKIHGEMKSFDWFLNKLDAIITFFLGMIITIVPKFLANLKTGHRLKSEVKSSLESILNCRDRIKAIFKDNNSRPKKHVAYENQKKMFSKYCKELKQSLEELSKINRAKISNRLNELSNRLEIAADNELNYFVDAINYENDVEFKSIFEELEKAKKDLRL